MQRRVAIVGSRDYDSYFSVRNKIEDLGRDVEFVSGGCPSGPDYWCKNLCSRFGFLYKEFPADWEQHGKKAGMLRNQEIVNYVDEVIAFWNGESPGTRDIIKRALRGKRRLEVIFE